MLEAKARVDRVLTALPNDVEALKLRARVLLSMDRNREALNDARLAVRLEGSDAEAHLILCEAARRSGDKELAERALNKAAELVTDDPILHVQLSWNAVLLDKLDEAEAFARIAVAAASDNAAAQYQLARVFILKQQTEDAAIILEDGLRNARLDAETVTADTILVRVAEHPSLKAYLKK
jgi:Flp pilus assembly protein TadD